MEKTIKRKKKVLEVIDDDEEIEVKPKKKKKKKDVEIEDIEIEIEDETEEVKKKHEKDEDEFVEIIENKEKLDPKVVLDIKFEIDDMILEADLNKMLHVPKFNQLTPEIVSNILAETPALHSRWNILYNQACQTYEKFKVDIDVWQSQTYEKYRNQIIEDGDKPTESRIDNLIKRDPEYKKMNYQLAELKQKMNTIKAAAIGFGSRGDKAVSIGHMLKREMSTLNDTETKIYDKI